MEGNISSFKRALWGGIRNGNQRGLILSLLIHGLVMIIPVSSIFTEQYEELEVLIIPEERGVIPPQQRVVKRVDPKINESPMITAPLKEEVEEVIEKDEEVKNEEVKKIEEKPIVERVGHQVTEPVSTRIEPPPVPVSIAVAVPPKESESFEKILPLPPAESSPKLEPRETVGLLKETVRPAVPSIGEVQFGTTEGPKFLQRVFPVYPKMAKRLGKEGRVLLRLTIDERGILLNVEVIENGGYGFTEAAVEAVKKSTFLPALRDGKPVASRALLPIRFTLRSE